MKYYLVLKGIVLGVCVACLDEPYWGFPLVIGVATLISINMILKKMN